MPLFWYNEVMDKKKEVIILLIILAVAIFFRFWKLSEIPPGLYPDVAINGNDALDALKTNHFKVFYVENNGREGLFINLIAFGFYVFGPSILVMKAIAAIIGTLTVLGFYFLTKELFFEKKYEEKTFIALLSAFFLATSFWHTNFSRIGFRAIMLPFCLVFSFYFLWRALRTQKISDYIISAVFFGLGFYTYTSFRMAVLILIVPIFFIWQKFIKEWLKKQGGFWKIYFKENYYKFDLWLLVVFFVALPIGLYFLGHSQDFMSRMTGISVFSQKNPILSFFESFIKHLGMFNFFGDPNWRHNIAGSPMLPFPLGILFIVGIIISFKEILSSIKNKCWSSAMNHWLIIAWFFAMLLPGVLTAEGLPHSLRVIGVIPPVYIFSGLGTFWLIKKSRPIINNPKLFFAFYFLLIFFIGYAEYDKYFMDWARNPIVKDAFTQRFVDVGKYLNSLPKDSQKYVIVNAPGVSVPWPNGLPTPAQTPIFIERTVFGEPRATYLKRDELDKISPEKETFIIPINPDKELLQKIQGLYPGGEIKNINNDIFMYKI